VGADRRNLRHAVILGTNRFGQETHRWVVIDLSGDEPHLHAWYEGLLGRVRIAGGDMPGRRNGGEYLYRVTPTGEFVLFRGTC
jgi:hypothetical protein